MTLFLSSGLSPPALPVSEKVRIISQCQEEQEEGATLKWSPSLWSRWSNQGGYLHVTLRWVINRPVSSVIRLPVVMTTLWVLSLVRESSEGGIPPPAPLIFHHFTSALHLWLLAAVNSDVPLHICAAVTFVLGLNWLLGSECGSESYGTNNHPLLS